MKAEAVIYKTKEDYVNEYNGKKFEFDTIGDALTFSKKRKKPCGIKIFTNGFLKHKLPKF